MASEDGYTHFTVNRECPQALQLHSTLHLSLGGLHQWVLRIDILIMNMNWSIWRSYGVGFLELRCASLLVLALQRSSAHIQRVVDCKLSFILLFLAFKQLTVTSYTASAYLVPKEHRARVRTLSFTCLMTLFIRSQNRLPGWWGGSTPSVRNTLKPIKCHPHFEIGQIAGISSGEFGLANMILAAVSVGTVRDLFYRPTLSDQRILK